VPIPFHEVGDIEELGSAGFLKLEPLVGHNRLTIGTLAGLLVINARGEPLEFAFNRVELRHPVLWGERVARCHLQRRLVASLLSVCSYDPRLLVCLDDEIDADLFGRELRIEVAIARLGAILPAKRVVDHTTGEVLDESSPVIPVTWATAQPSDDSAEHRLFERLGAHGLLLEPFERASLGLREVYSQIEMEAVVMPQREHGQS
jgi:hypothetical protein